MISWTQSELVTKIPGPNKISPIRFDFCGLLWPFSENKSRKIENGGAQPWGQFCNFLRTLIHHIFEVGSLNIHLET